MRTIIAGSRSIKDFAYLIALIQRAKIKPSVVLSGCASGVDLLGEQYAKQNNILLEYYPANWHQFGRRAGYLRNEIMASRAQAALILWNGTSKGTMHMINLSQKYGLKFMVYQLNNNTLWGNL